MDLMKFKSSFILLGALLLVGCNKSASSGNLVTVNGESVDMDTYYRYLEIKPTVQVDTGQGIQVAKISRSIGFQGMTDMIKQTLIMQIAKSQGVYPTSEDIEAEINFRKRSDPNFMKNLSNMGLNTEMIRRDLTISICEERVLTKGIKVSEEDVDRYIKDNPKNFVTPATADLLWILAKDDTTKAQAEKALGSGQSFNQVAQAYSADKNGRQSGYHYPVRVIEQMPSGLKDLIGQTSEGKSTDWIKEGDKWLKFYVERKNAEKPTKIDANVREFVRRKLARDRGSAANDLDKRIQEALLKAKIEVGPKMLQQTWQSEMENYRAQMSGGSGAATAPSTAPATK